MQDKTNILSNGRYSLVVAAVALAVTIGCNNSPTSSEGLENHGAEGTGGEAGESGVRYGLTEVFDEVQSGARLILRYDAASNSFVGTVENTTGGILRQVRVEVHLSNGTELGPTPAQDLAPGATRDVQLAATAASFSTWSAHPEVG